METLVFIGYTLDPRFSIAFRGKTDKKIGFLKKSVLLIKGDNSLAVLLLASPIGVMFFSQIGDAKSSTSKESFTQKTDFGNV